MVKELSKFEYIKSFSPEDFPKNTIIDKFSKNIKFLGRKLIPFDSIDANMRMNTARASGYNIAHRDKLGIAFNDTILTNQFLPVIEKLKVPKIVNGTAKHYKIIDFFHRYDYLKSAGYTHYWFDIIEFIGSETERNKTEAFFKLDVNRDYAPKLPTTEKDIISSISDLVHNGYIKKDYNAIYTELSKNASYLSKKRIKSIAMKVATEVKAYGNYLTWTEQNVEEQIEPVFNRTWSGKIDAKRNKHGFTTLGTSQNKYERRTMWKAIMSYMETGLESYIIGHVQNPSSDEELHQKRCAMAEEFDNLSKGLINVFEYYKKHNKLPWKLEGFLPQSQTEYEKAEIISVPKYKKNNLSTFLETDDDK